MRPVGIPALAAALLALAMAGTAAAQTPERRTEIDRQGEEALFRLEADQKAYTESLRALPSDRRFELQGRLLQQRLHQLDVQRRQLDLERARRPAGAPPSPIGTQAERGLMLQRLHREQETLRLHHQMQRQTWPYPKWWQ
jgi:hypothetical protein